MAADNGADDILFYTKLLCNMRGGNAFVVQIQNGLFALGAFVKALLAFRRFVRQLYRKVLPSRQ